MAVDKKLKIAFLNISYGAVDRGAEVFVGEVSERLKSYGHGVAVLTAKKQLASHWPIVWRIFLDPQGIQVCLFSLGKLGKIWREKYDIVVPIDGGWQPAWVRLVTWLYGGKMVISGQSGKGWHDRNNLWSFPDAFVAINTRLTSWAKKWQPIVKIVTIPNGVDTTKFTPLGKKIKTNLQKPIVLCVAALTKEKRIDLAIKAVANHPKASLLVVGTGNLRESLAKLGSKLLGDRFEIKSVTFEKMPQVYRRADVFTFPTVWWESFGIAMLEAMASGLPVVAADDPIRREIVDGAGLFIDPMDTKGYSTTLQKALDTKWQNKPRNQALKFDWNKIALEYEKLFVSLCKK